VEFPKNRIAEIRRAGKRSEARLLAEAAAEMENLNPRREVLRLAASQVVPGRIVVRLDAPEKMKGGPYDVELDDGDSVTVPRTPAPVGVIGSVRSPTAVGGQRSLGRRSTVGGPRSVFGGRSSVKRRCQS